ncbi:hypothetical protein AAMO2058_000048200 [Amorphochlora amoebiformis]
MARRPSLGMGFPILILVAYPQLVLASLRPSTSLRPARSSAFAHRAGFLSRAGAKLGLRGCSQRATESDLEGVGSSGQPFQGSSRRPFTSPSAILAELALVLALASPQASASVGIPEMPRTSVGVVQNVKDFSGSLEGIGSGFKEELSRKIQDVNSKIPEFDTSKLQELSGKIPDISGKVPDISGRFSDISGKLPDLGGKLNSRLDGLRDGFKAGVKELQSKRDSALGDALAKVEKMKDRLPRDKVLDQVNKAKGAISSSTSGLQEGYSAFVRDNQAQFDQAEAVASKGREIADRAVTVSKPILENGLKRGFQLAGSAARALQENLPVFADGIAKNAPGVVQTIKFLLEKIYNLVTQVIRFVLSALWHLFKGAFPSAATNIENTARLLARVVNSIVRSVEGVIQMAQNLVNTITNMAQKVADVLRPGFDFVEEKTRAQREEIMRTLDAVLKA